MTTELDFLDEMVENESVFDIEHEEMSDEERDEMLGWIIKNTPDFNTDQV